MGKKESAIPRVDMNAVLDISLQSVIDGVEDKLLLIDSKYHVRFANLAMRQMLPEGRLFIGKRCYEVFEGKSTPCSPPLWKCPLVKVFQSGSPKTLIWRDYSSNSDTASDRYVKIMIYPKGACF